MRFDILCAFLTTLYNPQRETFQQHSTVHLDGSAPQLPQSDTFITFIQTHSFELGALPAFFSLVLCDLLHFMNTIPQRFRAFLAYTHATPRPRAKTTAKTTKKNEKQIISAY